MNVRKRDIISTVKDQFISDKGASGHPALVLETQEDNIKVAIITDAKYKSKHNKSVMLPENTFGLTKDSQVICSKVGVINKSRVQAVIGRISKTKFKEVAAKFDSLNSRNNMFEYYLYS